MLRNREKYKYIIKYNAKVKMGWDILIILLAIFNSLLIPVNVAFNPHFTDTYVYKLINSGVINAIFVADILINFRTSVLIIRTGKEITNSKKIALRYILSPKFYIDLISSIPFDLIGTTDILGLLGLLKIVRLSRIQNLIEKSDVKKQNKLVRIFTIIIVI